MLDGMVSSVVDFNKDGRLSDLLKGDELTKTFSPNRFFSSFSKSVLARPIDLRFGDLGWTLQEARNTGNKNKNKLKHIHY